MPIPTIPTALPFDKLASAGQAVGGLLGGTPQQQAANLPAAYMKSWESPVAFNQALWGDTIAGYENTRASQADAFDSIGKGFTGLYDRVMGGLEGAGASERTGILDRYTAAQGQAGQSLVDRGLGNSTIVDSVNRGLASDRDKSLIDLAGQIAQMKAGYQTNLGIAGLNQQQQAALANTGLAQNQLGFMERVNAPYPDAGLYANLAQQSGFAGQAHQDRQQAVQEAQQAGQNAFLGANPVMPQSPGTVSKGGGGFFTQPGDYSSGGNYQPQSFGGSVTPQRPPAGPMNAPPPSYGQFGAPFGASAVAGVAGALAGGGLGRPASPEYDLRGEDMPFGQYENPWGNGGYGFGSYGQQQPAAPALTPDYFGYM